MINLIGNIEKNFLRENLIEQLLPPHNALEVLVDRPAQESIPVYKAHSIQNYILEKILPQSGVIFKKEQQDLAECILSAITKQCVMLIEAGSGWNETLSYLVPAILTKRGRLNDTSGLYPDMSYAEIFKMPIVIAASSIARQKVLLSEYIPELSRILQENGVIEAPITAVIRKGRKHYVCKRNLHRYLPYERDIGQKRKLEYLLTQFGSINLDELDIDIHVKKLISVLRCSRSICPYRETCKYQIYLNQAMTSGIDIQICDQNYLLADTRLRADGKKPLIPNYQVLIVEKSEKFIQAAQTIYQIELSSLSAFNILSTIDRVTFQRKRSQENAHRIAKKLKDESKRLFRGLSSNIIWDKDAPECYIVEVDKEASRHLQNIRDIAQRLSFVLSDEVFYVKVKELLAWIRRRYSLNMDNIDLGSILSASNDKKTSDDVRRQIIKIHRAICEIPALKQKMEIERFHRQKRLFCFKPEHQLIQLNTSVISDVILDKTRSLLTTKSMIRKSYEIMATLMSEIDYLRNNAAAFCNHNELICWLKTDGDADRLYGVPKNLSRHLYNQQWSRGIPTILISRKYQGHQHNTYKNT